MKHCSKENVNKELSVVVLADTHLLSLPLETLPLLKRENIGSVSRDFSLQMLQHRMSKNLRETSGEFGKKYIGRRGERKKKGLSGNRTRDLSHPKRESYL